MGARGDDDDDRAGIFPSPTMRKIGAPCMGPLFVWVYCTKMCMINIIVVINIKLEIPAKQKDPEMRC